MRYLAIDLGDKRTGLAMGDDETRVATPVGVVEVPLARSDGGALLEALAGEIEARIGEDAPGELVVGLPLNMDGSEGPRAKLVRAFADRLERHTGRRVHLCDERLTTVDADWRWPGPG